MSLLNKLLFGNTFRICAFCGRWIRISDTVFHTENVSICKECNKNIKIAPFQTLNPGTEHVCFVISPLYYSGVVRDAVHNLKFSSMPAISDAFGYYLSTYLSTFENCDDPLSESFDCVMPVPLSDKRRNERGYNQAELLAKTVSECLGLSLITDALIKIKDTPPQSSLTIDERKTNLTDSYLVTKDVRNMRILLVDDVFTTGSTLEFCGKALSVNGASNIGAVVLSSGNTRKHSQLYHELFS